MIHIHKALTNELEATTYGLQRQVADLQKNITKLQHMVNGSDETWNQYQFSIWTQGEAAQRVTEIASLLSRQRTLQEALHLLDKPEE
jgi:hypothetical protein